MKRITLAICGLLLLRSPAGAALPADLTLQLPFPCGSKVYIYCGYNGEGGTYGYCPLHVNADLYALDFTYSYPSYNPRNGLGRPVAAVAAGKVVASGSFGGYGTAVLIEHQTSDGPYNSLYAHLQSASVAKGASIASGQEIGKLGMSGNANGVVHLHFVLRKGGDVGTGTAVRPEPMSGQTGFTAEHHYTVVCSAPPPDSGTGPPPRDGGPGLEPAPPPPDGHLSGDVSSQDLSSSPEGRLVSGCSLARGPAADGGYLAGLLLVLALLLVAQGARTSMLAK
jgi:hypothetical protein